MSATDYLKLGKVAVLMGGMSSEREVSLNSGKAVLAGLTRKGVNVVGIDVDDNLAHILKEQNIERVFNVLHGKGGEDGQVQALLEFAGIPYTGSGVAASAIAMNKLLTKKIWLSEGLPTPKWKVLNSESDALKAADELGLPLIVKPIEEGSSVGISKVKEKTDVVAAWVQAKQYGVVIAEQFIDGAEYTVSILDKKALPVIRLEPANDFYDYEAKYLRDDTVYHCPCGLSAEQELVCQSLALKAFDSLGAYGWGRVDFMMSSSGDMYLIELNTVPGMTDHSLVPMAAKQVGIEFDELVVQVLEIPSQGASYA